MSKTRLIEAVKTLDLKETKRILEAKPELLKVWNDQGRNLLHLACGANPKKLHKPESAGAKLVTFLLDRRTRHRGGGRRRVRISASRSGSRPRLAATQPS